MPIRRPARHRSRRPGRIRPLWVLSLLPVLLVSGFYLTRVSTAGTAQTAYPQLATGGCASQRPAAQRVTPGSLPGAAASPCAAQPLTSSAGAGVHWTSAGENIGEGGPVAGTDSAVAQLAVTITQDMLNEKPPDDGHRLNILSSAFHHIGIAVLRSDSGTVWMTQDFSD